MLLKAENLIKRYRRRAVVNDVSLEVNQGEIVGLLGTNGAGKTTTFYMIVGLIRPNSGRIFLDDKNITTYPMFKRGKLGIGYLAQEASVFRNMTVSENILAVLEMGTKMTSAERKDKVDELMEEFSITHIRNSLGRVLSGGERRRTEIARALAVNPKFILLDEPFAGIDPIAKEDIRFLVTKLVQKNIGILITDHDVETTLKITDRAYLLSEGKLRVAGTPEELANNEMARKLYLGENFQLNR
ncbi:MAG: LPS export ABC transporter ATP-binding protein [Bacteroidia bacterium]|nr:LPS export ABC transporter ATP-binding protein [Bacteroidia bacterium]